MNVTYQNALINLKRFTYYFKTSKRQKDRLCIKLRFLFEFQLQNCVSYQRLVTSHCKTLIYKSPTFCMGRNITVTRRKYTSTYIRYSYFSSLDTAKKAISRLQHKISLIPLLQQKKRCNLHAFRSLKLVVLIS